MSRGILFICAVVFFVTAGPAAGAPDLPLKGGDEFPELELVVPAPPFTLDYLGLGNEERFTLSDVKAELVLVEILSVYCATCQQQVPYYNQLYGMIEEDPRTRGKIKILGIAAGNGEREIANFREEYDVRFPVAEDPGFAMHKAVGGTRTPFTIYVRQDGKGEAGRVVDTHLGPNRDVTDLFEKLLAMIQGDTAAPAPESGEKFSKALGVKPILSETVLGELVKTAFAGLGGTISGFQRVDLPIPRLVFTAMTGEGEDSRRVFGEVVRRPSICDVCHDIHFIYLFDPSGKVIRFVPLQLTKTDNRDWDKEDIRMMREKVIGRSINRPWVFNSEVDAVSSATITSAVIFDALAQGDALLEALRQKGLL
ncbi:MAG: TlpA family protein disulfide reductase [Desulfobacterales bacterium]|nr:TlpA family protein disulfide reductase [Desulfobacterales bacterium]